MIHGRLKNSIYRIHSSCRDKHYYRFPITLTIVFSLFIFQLSFAQQESSSVSELEISQKPKRGYFVPSERKGPKKVIKLFAKSFEFGLKEIEKRREKEVRKFSISSDLIEMPRWQTGDIKIWHKAQNAFLFSPMLSPNRYWAAYLSQIKSESIKSSIIISNMDKSIQLKLPEWSQNAGLYDEIRSKYNFSLDPGLCWSASGQVLAATGIQRDQKDIFFFPLPLGEEKVVIYYQVTNDEANEFQPVFSTNNQYFAYCSDEGGTYRVRYVDLKTWRTYIIDPEGDPTFSPDFHPSENILSYVRDEDGTFSIVTLDLEAQEEEVPVFNLTSPDIFPTWSPNGNSIAYYSNSEIHSVNINSNETRVMTKDAYSPRKQTFLSKLVWLPNSEQVIYPQNSQKKAPIYFSTYNDKGSTLIPWKETSFNEQLHREGSTLFYASFHTKRWAIYKTKIEEYVPTERDIQDVVTARVYSAKFTGKALLEGEEEARNISEGEMMEAQVIEAEVELMEPAMASEEMIYEMNETQKKKIFHTFKSMNYSDVFEQKMLYVQIVDKFAKTGRKYTLIYREESGGGPGGARR